MSEKLDKEYILEQLKTVEKEFPMIKVGLAGSYARGQETANSDIDIVLASKSDEKFNSDFDINITIYSFLLKLFNDNEIDMLWLSDLYEDTVKSDELSKELDIPINQYTPFRTISREVIWCGEC
jgi:predicted nucleotidyltransferase